jgi:hypothetical protein
VVNNKAFNGDTSLFLFLLRFVEQVKLFNLCWHLNSVLFFCYKEKEKASEWLKW